MPIDVYESMRYKLFNQFSPSYNWNAQVILIKTMGNNSFCTKPRESWIRFPRSYTPFVAPAAGGAARRRRSDGYTASAEGPAQVHDQFTTPTGKHLHCFIFCSRLRL